MIDESTLLAAIAAAPEDEGPRLVYADWLLDRGDARGELIHLHLSRDPQPAVHERIEALLAEHQEAWFGVRWDPRVRLQLDRGFPTGRFGHSGLFVSAVHEPESEWDPGTMAAFACQRYFPDGTMLSVSIGGSPTPEVFAQIAKWFVHGYQKGEYALGCTPGGPASLHAISRSEAGVVEYDGPLLGTRLDFTNRSHINGYEGTVRLELVDVDGCDSRPAWSVRGSCS